MKGESYLPVFELELRNCFWVQKSAVAGHCRKGNRQWPATADCLIGSGRPLPIRQSAVAYGETQFSELKNSFWTQTQKQVYRIHDERIDWAITAFAVASIGAIFTGCNRGYQQGKLSFMTFNYSNSILLLFLWFSSEMKERPTKWLQKFISSVTAIFHFVSTNSESKRLFINCQGELLTHIELTEASYIFCSPDLIQHVKTVAGKYGKFKVRLLLNYLTA